jgi:hypothetical protein
VGRVAKLGSLGVFGVDDMSFTIEQSKEKRESFGSYTYRIYEAGRLVAYYWHDHRGDEHGIEFTDGSKELWPVGRMVDFIQGGGPEPLTLSQRAVDYLKQKRP